jgi:hypothetical protein
MDGKELENLSLMLFTLEQVFIYFFQCFGFHIFLALFVFHCIVKAATQVPEALKKALKPGGRMV